MAKATQKSFKSKMVNASEFTFPSNLLGLRPSRLIWLILHENEFDNDVPIMVEQNNLSMGISKVA